MPRSGEVACCLPSEHPLVANFDAVSLAGVWVAPVGDADRRNASASHANRYAEAGTNHSTIWISSPSSWTQVAAEQPGGQPDSGDGLASTQSWRGPKRTTALRVEARAVVFQAESEVTQVL